MALGDFNGDGALDLATSNFNGGTVSVLFNNGDGTFGAGNTYLFGYSFSGLAVGDLNGDGAPDIALTNFYNSAVSVLTNNGDGTFAYPVSYYLAANYAISVTLGDVNNDGSLDIVVGSDYNSSFTAGNVSVLLNHGDGTFGAAAERRLGL